MARRAPSIAGQIEGSNVPASIVRRDDQEPRSRAPDGRTVPQVYGLLYLAESSERIANLDARRDAHDVYLKCAFNSARSFERHGYPYALITNRPDAIEARASQLGLRPPPLIAMEFHRDVPGGIGFASAHRKIEVLEHFGTGEFGPRPMLVDLDTELVRPFPSALLDNAEALHALDLTCVIEAEFGPAMETYLSAILAAPVADPRWYGGEFLCGPAPLFARIAQSNARCRERYFAHARGSIHEGDEALTSAALNELRGEGVAIADAGANGTVTRWWSARTTVAVPQFSQVSSAALLHLPADKPFLAARAGTDPDPARFVADYRRAIGRKLALRRTGSAIERLIGRKPVRFAPRW
jgi:hypothetical protein